MAKKSSKSKKITLSVEKLVYACAAVLGLVALFLIFAPALNVSTSLTVSTYTGTQVVFGLEDYFAFSFMNLLTYLLLLGGIVLVVLKLVGLKSKLFDLLGAALLIAAGVLFFITVGFTILTDGYASIVALAGATKSLAAGPIVAGILSLLSGAGVLCYALLGKK